MFQIVLGILLLIFGVFLKITNDPGFAKSKKFAWMFIAIGLLSVLAKIFILYQQKNL